MKDRGHRDEAGDPLRADPLRERCWLRFINQYAGFTLGEGVERPENLHVQDRKGEHNTMSLIGRSRISFPRQGARPQHVVLSVNGPLRTPSRATRVGNGRWSIRINHYIEGCCISPIHEIDPFTGGGRRVDRKGLTHLDSVVA